MNHRGEARISCGYNSLCGILCLFMHVKAGRRRIQSKDNDMLGGLLCLGQQHKSVTFLLLQLRDKEEGWVRSGEHI
jgi:hypothetical protein